MLLYTWDKAGFEKAYWRQYYRQRGCGAARAHNCRCAEVDITYSRLFFEDDQLFNVRAQNIVTNCNIPEGSDIFVGGCALGFLMEALKTLGMNVWGCDSSRYIHTIKNKEKVKFAIHDVSLTEAQFVTKTRNATGAMWFDYVITEDVLTSHDSYTGIFNNIEGILNPSVPKSNIIHLVDTNALPPFEQKTLEEWRTLNANHTWLNGLGEAV
jgi:2-polyprenyl-3-methyl-5-hydroxy-6-metoxy-1,4-benzoquinol methylase